LLANDADVDDPTSELRVEVVDQSQFTPAVGTLAVQPGGSFTFTPASANVVGAFSFTYRVVDNGQPTEPARASADATATITVLGRPHDRPPGGVVDEYPATEDTVLNVVRPVHLIGFGDEWSYFDDMQNGLQSIPQGAAETYPVDSTADVDATPGVADAWFSENFDTATSNPAIGTWKTGRGIFAGPIRGMAYGPGRTALGGIGNALAVPGQNTVTTYLFRRTFVLENAESVSQMIMDVLVDDGAVFYINGAGLRLRMDSPITSTTLANAAGVETNYQTAVLTFNPGLLHDGINTIAVEVHQQSLASSDAGFDLALSIAPGPGVLANDVDPEGDAFVNLRVVREPENGTVVLNDDGTFSYTPDENFNGVDTFDYVVTANGLDSAPTTVFIDVESVDDPPVANDDVYSVRNDQTLVLDAAAGALANDTGDGTLNLVIDLSGGEIIEHEAGLFVWNNTNGNLADGSIIFEPTPGFVGTFAVTYTVQDSQGLTDTATVTINVLPSTTPGDLDADGDVDTVDLATGGGCRNATADRAGGMAIERSQAGRIVARRPGPAPWRRRDAAIAARSVRHRGDGSAGSIDDLPCARATIGCTALTRTANDWPPGANGSKDARVAAVAPTTAPCTEATQATSDIGTVPSVWRCGLPLVGARRGGIPLSAALAIGLLGNKMTCSH
jgi:VCBS repeat-containing protein